MLDIQQIPKHVAIIMDGNRRWAKKRGLPAIAGHAEAVDHTVETLIERAGELGVKYLTLWAFSTENWGREATEVTGLMNLFRKALMTKVERFITQGARLQLIGDMSRFAPDIQDGMKQAVAASEHNDKITVTFALNYGGRDEIVRAVVRCMNQDSRFKIQELDQDVFACYLDTAGMPDPDLIIRTGGEQRLSGFLLWQAAYSELLFVDTLFPDFGPAELDAAIENYQGRQRRFGK
jgi:undecaprenyl diphosphate synthase